MYDQDLPTGSSVPIILVKKHKIISLMHIDSSFSQRMILIVVCNLYGVWKRVCVCIIIPPTPQPMTPITNSVDKVTMFQEILCEQNRGQ